MADELTKAEMTTLEKELRAYFKANSWMDRRQVAQRIEKEGVGLPGSDKRLFPIKEQVAEVLSKPMFSSEKAVGKVIVSGTGNKTTTVFHPANELLDYEKRGAEYRISEDGYDGGYKVERFAPGGLVKEVKNMPVKKWAIAYAVHRMDKTQPVPPKFTPRERISAKDYTFHPVGDDVAGAVDRYGNQSAGIDTDTLEWKPALLYGGRAKGVFADGFMLILDKAAADKLNDKFIKKDATVMGKFNQKFVDDQLKEYKDKFPDYEKLIPTEELSTWQIVGFGSLGSGTYSHKDRTVVAYLSDGRGVAVVDADKLAVIYDNISGVNKIEGSGPESPFRLSVGGKVVAVVMPVFADQGNIPKDKIMDAVSSILGPRPRISKHKNVKGKGRQVVMYNSVPMRRSDVYRSLIAIGKSKKDSQQDAFSSYTFHITAAEPVAYADYQEVDKTQRAREQKIYDNWSRRLEEHRGDNDAREKITHTMQTEREELRKKWDIAIARLVEDAKSGVEKRAIKTPAREGTIPREKIKESVKKAPPSKSALQAIEDARSPRSKSSDESQSNLDTIEPDDPRVESWIRDQGRMDVVGIDTPRKDRSKKSTRKSKQGAKTPTQVRWLRR